MVQDSAETMLGGILAQFADLHPESQLYARVVGYAGGDDPGAIQVAPIACGRETLAGQRVVPLAVLEKLCRVREAAVAAFERRSSGEGHISLAASAVAALSRRARSRAPMGRPAGATTMSDHDDSLKAAFAALEADGLAAVIFFRFASCAADAIALPHYDRTLRPALAQIGAPVIAISPQVPERLAAVVATHRLEIEVLSDPDNRLARRLGLTFVPDKRPRRRPPAGSAR